MRNKIVDRILQVLGILLLLTALGFSIELASHHDDKPAISRSSS